MSTATTDITGINIPELENRPGIMIKSSTISTVGITASFQLFAIKTTPSAPKTAQDSISVGQVKHLGEQRIGVDPAGNGELRAQAPRSSISVVTMDDTAHRDGREHLALLGGRAGARLAQRDRAAGTFILARLPVTNARYVPPEPTIVE